MILLQLFWNFLVIGAVSFGGGYGMISLVRETVLGHGWLTESEFLSFIAVSESMAAVWPTYYVTGNHEARVSECAELKAGLEGKAHDSPLYCQSRRR